MSAGWNTTPPAATCSRSRGHTPSALRAVVAAAARSNQAAATQTRDALTARLLDNARLLVALDAREPLTVERLEPIVERHKLFRVTILGPSGEREHFVMAHGTGAGGGWLNAPGAGIGPGANQLIERLIAGKEAEAVTDLHAGRRGGLARLAVGARRANGGAVLISVDATDVAALERQASIDHLLSDVVASAPDVAYVILDHGDTRSVQGVALPDALVNETVDRSTPGEPEHRHAIDGRPILELGGPIPLADPATAWLRIGMRLDGLDEITRRTLWRSILSLAAAIAVGALALGLVWLQRDYGTLAEAHARAREALQRRDRLAAMGELSSTVAHEIRNPLNAIAMSAQRLHREYGDALAHDEDAGALLDVIRSESQRLDLKVHQFLDYARPPRLVPRDVDLAAWLTAAVEAQRARAESHDVSLMPLIVTDAVVTMDADQVQQVVDNLVRNAIDAAPPGGHVWVRAFLAGDEVVVEVHDDGPGIPDDVKSRVFDLYFTTKRDGTGVGLAVAHQIMTAHGGRIEVSDREPGPGTVMSARWPRSVPAPVMA